MSTPKNKIGLRLRTAFQELGITPALVGKHLGIPTSTVYGWTQGLREPKGEILEKIVREFNINPNYILLGEGPPILPGPSRKVSPEEEELLMERHRYLVAVLENIFESWKIIPKAVIDGFKEEGILKKALKPVKAAYSLFLELPAGAIYFFLRSYWYYSMQAIWRVYWALNLDREPRSQDIALVATLYYRDNDFLAAAERLVRELEKDWSINREAIEKEKFPIKLDQSIEPETSRFLRLAAMDLIDLYKKRELPSLCLVHHRVYWSECPECKKDKLPTTNP